MFFNGWTGIWRTFVVGILAYITLILLLRISGKRTLSKMNAFDFVVTVAIGSTLATILLSKTVALLEGILALALLIFLQYAITWASIHYKFTSRIVKSEPRLLYHKGEFINKAVKEERIMKEEILQAVRNQGIASLTNVQSVVLETDGSFSIIKSSGESNQSTLSNVQKGSES